MIKFNFEGSIEDFRSLIQPQFQPALIQRGPFIEPADLDKDAEDYLSDEQAGMILDFVKDEAASVAESAPEQTEAQKRKRRTKAEIEAEKAKEEAELAAKQADPLSETHAAGTVQLVEPPMFVMNGLASPAITEPVTDPLGAEYDALTAVSSPDPLATTSEAVIDPFATQSDPFAPAPAVVEPPKVASQFKDLNEVFATIQALAVVVVKKPNGKPELDKLRTEFGIINSSLAALKPEDRIPFYSRLKTISLSL